MFAMTPKSRVVFVHALNELKKDIAPVVKGLLVNHSLAIKPEGASPCAYLMCTVILDEELPWIAAGPKQPILQALIDLNGATLMGSGSTNTFNGDRPPINDATPANQIYPPPPSSANNNLPQTTTNTSSEATTSPSKPAAPRPRITKPRPKPTEQGSNALKRRLVQSGESSEENEHVAKQARPAPRSTGMVETSSSPISHVETPLLDVESSLSAGTGSVETLPETRPPASEVAPSVSKSEMVAEPVEKVQNGEASMDVDSNVSESLAD